MGAYVHLCGNIRIFHLSTYKIRLSTFVFAYVFTFEALKETFLLDKYFRTMRHEKKKQLRYCYILYAN